MTTTALDVDVLIVGAGISGIDMAVRMGQLVPDLSLAILEARPSSGGTWDLFRYPGIRSDSDMYTLAFPFKPWTHPTSISSGESILSYLRETIEEFGLTERIHYGQRVRHAAWSSTQARWQVTVTVGDEQVTHTARFLYLATGYYDYDHGHVVDFPGESDFAGRVVHPQAWPDDLDVTGQRIVVIGSGATAVTLVPALVDQGAAHVIMLQRSPTYLITLPGRDPVATAAFRALPARAAHRVVRAKNVAFNVASYAFARRFPGAARSLLTKGVAAQLPKGYAVAPDFVPRYDPWDQRLCVVPDSDLFAAITSGRASVVTDVVDRFVPEGVRTVSGETLEADLIVTATGLELVVAGKIDVDVDGERVDPARGYVYRGLMLSDVPNLAWCVGYTNNSWTLRADLTARWTCRLLRHLVDQGYASATPRYAHPDPDHDKPVMDMTSGYIQRAAAVMPRQGAKAPWAVKQNYVYDLAQMSGRTIEDGHLEFTR